MCDYEYVNMEICIRFNTYSLGLKMSDCLLLL